MSVTHLDVSIAHPSQHYRMHAEGDRARVTQHRTTQDSQDYAGPRSMVGRHMRTQEDAGGRRRTQEDAGRRRNTEHECSACHAARSINEGIAQEF